MKITIDNSDSNSVDKNFQIIYDHVKIQISNGKKVAISTSGGIALQTYRVLFRNLFSNRPIYKPSRDGRIAFMMAWHKRLGKDSPLRIIPRDVGRMISTYICEQITVSSYSNTLSEHDDVIIHTDLRIGKSLHAIGPRIRIGVMIECPIDPILHNFKVISDNHKFSKDKPVVVYRGKNDH